MTGAAFRKLRAATILLADMVLLVALFSLVYRLRLGQLPDYLAPELWLIFATFTVTLFVSGTYFRTQSTRRPRLPVRTFWVSMVAGLLCILWVYLLGPSEFNTYFGRGVLPTATIWFGIAATLARWLINRYYFRQEQGVTLMYLGFSQNAEHFLEELKNHAEVRSVTLYTNKEVPPLAAKVTVLPPQANDRVFETDWNGIIVDPNHQSDSAEIAQLVAVRLRGTPVQSLAEYYEQNWYMVPIDHIGDEWFLQAQGFSMLGNPVALRVKRLGDIAMAFCLLLASIPLIALSAIAIKLSSRGPILFRQRRVGAEGNEFTIYKLRTMVDDAEADGAQWASENDPRVTRVGNFLRKSRLDELPQTWNVLKGDMSFVGPRPERPEFTEELARDIPYYDLRHLVKPGITGWAQVIYPYGASTEDAVKKLQYELYYIKNQSLLLDLNIILRTLITVLQRHGR